MVHTSNKQQSDKFNPLVQAAGVLKGKSRNAMNALYAYISAAYEVANNKDSELAAHELADMRRQTEDAIESGRHLNPIIRDFGITVRTYKIDEQLIEALFDALYMDTANTTLTHNEYRKYISGVGEAVGLMAFKILCYKRAVIYHKLTPVARALGAAICKVTLINNHGKVHKRHGRLYFPDVTKSTFNQARLAQIIVDIEADFRLARSGIDAMPPGSRKAVALVYAYYYDMLRQMRDLTPAQIDAGKVQISAVKQAYLKMYAYIAPDKLVKRGSRY
jgi:phytoene/squalene synthetase